MLSSTALSTPGRARGGIAERRREENNVRVREGNRSDVARERGKPEGFSGLPSSLARSILSSSTSEEPVLRPRALRKVKTMPPPMTSLSHLDISESMTPILDETLEPPTMAAKGRLGLDTAPSR